MDYNWKNKSNPSQQGGNSWSNNPRYGQNQNVSYPSSYYNNQNVVDPQNSYCYDTPASNSYNTPGGGYGDEGTGYNNRGNTYNNRGNSRKRSYNSFQTPNARTFNIQNNYDDNNFNYADSYAVGPQFLNNREQFASYGDEWQSYDNNPRSYDNRHLQYSNNPGTMSRNRVWIKDSMAGTMGKGKSKKQRKRLNQEARLYEAQDKVRQALEETKQHIMLQLKEVLTTPGSDELATKTSQVLHDRLRMIIGDDKNPIKENLIEEYRDIYPASLDERFVKAVKKRMEGEVAEDEAGLLSERDKVVMSNTQYTLKDPAVKKQLSETPSNPQLSVRKKFSSQGSTEFQARLSLTVDNIDEAIAIRTEQFKQLMLEMDEECASDEVLQFVHGKLMEGGATLVKHVLARTLSKGLLRPDADPEYLMLRIMGQPKLPPQLCLEELLEPYNIRELKKSFKDKQLLVVRVKTRKDFEELLAKDQIVIAGVPVSIKKGEKMEINMEKFLRKNKTWIRTTTLEEQQRTEELRTRKEHFLKEQTARKEEEKMKTQGNTEDEGDKEEHEGPEGEECVDEGEGGGQEDMASHSDTEGQGDAESQADMDGQEDVGGHGAWDNIEG